MIKKIIVVFVVFFSVGMLCVGAETEKIYIGDKIPNVFIRKVESNGKETVKQGGFLRRRSDNQFVYCLEPFVSLIDDYSYEAYIADYPELLNVSEEVWNKISLIAYYGYQYGDHTADYWYYITQVMIWREVDKDAQFYFTNTLGGPNDYELFAAEIKEIEDLVAQHYILPGFDEIILGSGETKRFKDKNGVLNNFTVVDNENVVIEENELVVTGNDVGSKRVTLQKISSNFKDAPIVYIDTVSQNVMSAGFLEPISCEIIINVLGGKLKIIKKDALNGEVLKIEGIKFAIYEADSDKLVFEGKTNSEGILETNFILKDGKYKIVEVEGQNIAGYDTNKEEVYFEVKGQEEVVIEFFNYPITGEIKVIKKDEDNKLLEGVTFGLYDEEDRLVDILKTNTNGEAIFTNLKAGKYQLKELATVGDYILDDKVYDIELVLENQKIEAVEIEVINTLPKGSLEIVKVNKENEPLPDTEFIIYNEAKEIVVEVKTDETGKVRVDNLELGKYFLEETVAYPGYSVIDELIEFEIKEDGEIITVNIVNEEIEVDVPDTEISFGIDKFIIEQKNKKVCKLMR